VVYLFLDFKFRQELCKIESLKEKATRKKAGKFFYCANCHIEYEEEDSLVHNYTCPECGESLSLKDNSEEIRQTDKDIEKLREVLVEVNSEIEVIEAKDQKTRNRKMKAEQRKKTKERAARKKEREKIANKEKKKIVAKKSKKKIKKGKK